MYKIFAVNSGDYFREEYNITDKLFKVIYTFNYFIFILEV